MKTKSLIRSRNLEDKRPPAGAKRDRRARSAFPEPLSEATKGYDQALVKKIIEFEERLTKTSMIQNSNRDRQRDDKLESKPARKRISATFQKSLIKRKPRASFSGISN